LPSCYPKSLKYLGDHIRKRRLDLQFLQREVAIKIGVSEATIYNWENSNTTPSLSSTPKMIAFLGYNPDDSAGKTLGEQIKKARKVAGLSQRRLAKLLGVDPTTLARWERGEAEPLKKSVEIIERFLKQGFNKYR
jgi:transcriptional regulator with XRE-family HTH domain